MSASLEIQLIAALTAAGCAIPGVFLLLRKMSMVSDSITHTILRSEEHTSELQSH